MAGKTGTTNDYRDAWFSGFNSAQATTVWVGFDDPKPLGRGEAGSKAALPIWMAYIEAIKKDLPVKSLRRPGSVSRIWINKETGKRTTEDDPNAIAEYFIRGTEPEMGDSAATPDINKGGDKTDGTDGDTENAKKKTGKQPKKATDIF